MIILALTAVYLWDFLLPGMPTSFSECIAKGGTSGKNITEKGVENNSNECVFEAKNAKQERECKQKGGESRVGGQCPCCSIIYTK